MYIPISSKFISLVIKKNQSKTQKKSQTKIGGSFKLKKNMLMQIVYLDHVFDMVGFSIF